MSITAALREAQQNQEKISVRVSGGGIFEGLVDQVDDDEGTVTLVQRYQTSSHPPRTAGKDFVIRLRSIDAVTLTWLP